MGLLVRSGLDSCLLYRKEGLVWVQINLEGGRKLAVASIYANPEGVRSAESEEFYREVGVAVDRFRAKGYEVLVTGDFNAHIGLGEENSANKNGKRLLALVESSGLVIGNKLSICKGRWTWECGERRSVVDYILYSNGLVLEAMRVEDGGVNDLGSDHNLLWCKVKCRAPKVVDDRCYYKWRVDGKENWEGYRSAIESEFVGWEECMESIKKDVSGEECVEKIWENWRSRVINAAYVGIGKKKVGGRSKAWWTGEIEEAIRERRIACSRLRSARRKGLGEGCVMRCWENYRNKRKIVKALIREEKMRSRKLIVRKIKEQGGVGCKLFWSDLKGRSGNKSKM